MEVAGAIGWTPAVFWAATPKELWSFFAGWRRANCPEDEKREPTGVSREEMEEMMQRFPDTVGSIRNLPGARPGLPDALAASK